MSNVDSTKAARVQEFCEYTKALKEAQDKGWAMERERIRLLDEGDRRYYEQLEKDMKATLEKHLRGVGQRQTGAPEGQVLK